MKTTQDVLDWLQTADDEGFDTVGTQNVKRHLESVQNEQLKLCEESQRRELLIAFFDSIEAEDMEQQRNSKGWKVVDNYLKTIL